MAEHRSHSPSSPRRDRYARDPQKRHAESDDELDDKKDKKTEMTYDPFKDALDGARSVHELSGKAAIPPPSSYQQSLRAQNSWRGGSNRGAPVSKGAFSLAALAKVPAVRKTIWSKPVPANQLPASVPQASKDPTSGATSVWQGAEFEDASKKAKFLALMGARSIAASATHTAAEYDPFEDTAGSALSSAEIAERERELAATYAAAATHTRGTGLGLSDR